MKGAQSVLKPWVRTLTGSSRPPPVRWVGASVGAVAAILIHVLVIEAVLLGTAGREQHPHRDEGLGANAVASDEEATATLILIEEPSDAPSPEDFMERLASHGVVLQNLRLTIVSPEPALAAPIESESNSSDPMVATDESSSDRSGRALLFGRYLGQIQARVERAWVRPRTPIGEELFECRLQVLQSKRGDVLEVTLQRCNGDTRWQVSLVQAIERASPLPAPPDPAVFAESLQLSFRSNAFNAQSTTDGFESAATVLAQNSSRTNTAQFIADEPPSAVTEPASALPDDR